MTLPTRWIRSAGWPSAKRLSTASGDEARRSSLTLSVTSRFTSSGIVQSRLRNPDSTWATRAGDLAATRAAAMVEFTSPTTTTTSGATSDNTGSMASITLAV